MTANGRSMAKTLSVSGIQLSATWTAARARDEFQAFWKAILTGPATPPLEGEPLGPADLMTPTQRIATDYPENASLDVLIGHEDFVHILLKVPKNKACSDDGVLGE